MDKITLKNGKEFNVGTISVIPSPSMVYLRIYGSTLSEIDGAFSNPDNFSEITYNDHVISGFTKLDAIIFEENGCIRIRLVR